MSTAQLAERIGCSRRSVEGWEAESARPKWEQVEGLCRVLEVSADYIYGLPMGKRRGRA